MHYVMAKDTQLELVLALMERKLADLERDNYSVYLPDAPTIFESKGMVYMVQKVVIEHDKSNEHRYYYTTGDALFKYPTTNAVTVCNVHEDSNTDASNG